MKFSSIDKTLDAISWNTLDLIHFDQIKRNSQPWYPAFICKWGYIKTITRFGGVDFFNLTVKEQEERLRLWGFFLSTLRIPTQIFVVAKPIDTSRYQNELMKQVKDSPYINEEFKKKMLQGIPKTLDYIQRDGSASSFKKEYYIITSCTIKFTSNITQEDQVNEDDSTPYYTWTYREYSSSEWEKFNEEFNEYYLNMLWQLMNLAEQNQEDVIEPLVNENQIVGLFAELNNDIPRSNVNWIELM